MELFRPSQNFAFYESADQYQWNGLETSLLVEDLSKSIRRIVAYVLGFAWRKQH